MANTSSVRTFCSNLPKKALLFLQRSIVQPVDMGENEFRIEFTTEFTSKTVHFLLTMGEPSSYIGMPLLRVFIVFMGHLSTRSLGRFPMRPPGPSHETWGSGYDLIAIFGDPEQRVHVQLQLMSSRWPNQQDFGHLVLDLLIGWLWIHFP